MSEAAIVVNNVSKKYRLFNSARDRLKEALHPFSKHYHREFWALKGVSFEVPQGQTVGILGRNGSGKSTLLQIIAGIMQPTSGEVIVNGRVSALLELGAGFNPEFTGRENVLFQAQVMGLSREEMDRRLPEIEAFADVGEFFDQPVKTYSSGMFVRVAFAAATNVDPEILIVDEALAIGDAKFQQRCFQKFREFQERSITILLVTHAAELVIRHCSRAVLLNQGQLIVDGAPEAVARQYIDLLEERDSSPSSRKAVVPSVAESGAASVRPFRPALGVAGTVNGFLVERPNTDQCWRRTSYNPGEYAQDGSRADIVDYLVVRGNSVDPTHITSGDEIDIYVKVLFQADVERPCFGIALKSKDGVEIYALNSAWTTSEPIPARAGEFRVVRFHLTFALNSGDIFLDVGVDELKDATRYTNICRRMALVHFVIHCNKLFHGLADLDATFSESSISGKALLEVGG
jgi:ABC-type polysaccharide/polyol phosphate transport system ATPase subunit